MANLLKTIANFFIDDKGNKGVLPPVVRPEDFTVSGESGVVYKEVNPSGDWLQYLPPIELQYGTYIGTQACAIFSALNCLETQLKQQGEDINLSDRFTAKIVNNTYQGSQLSTVADSLRKQGCVLEVDYPFDRSRAGKMDWELFYQDIPAPLIDKAKWLVEKYDIRYEWVNMGDCHPDLEVLKKHLKQAPLQLASAYNDKTCVCQHATMIYKIDDNGIYIFDSMEETGVRVLPLDYGVPWVLKYVITPKQSAPAIGLIPPLTKDLFYGQTDTQVIGLKKGLIKLGYLSPLMAPNLNGYYGEATRSAVLRFQKAQGICILCVSQGKQFTLNSRALFNKLISQ